MIQLICALFVFITLEIISLLHALIGKKNALLLEDRNEKIYKDWVAWLQFSLLLVVYIKLRNFSSFWLEFYIYTCRTVVLNFIDWFWNVHIEKVFNINI